MPLSVLTATAAALLIVVVVVATLRMRRRGQALPTLTIIPVASEAGPGVRIEVANEGTAAMHAPGVALRPAPPGVMAERVLDVVPPAVERRPLPRRVLAPGASTAIDLPCPLQPGEVYMRVLGLAPDAPADAAYGLPVETLLAIEVDWRAAPPWRSRSPHRLVLVRGGGPGDAHPRAA